MNIKDKVKKVGVTRYGGSSTRRGKLYHELPFEGLKDFNRHRGGTRERIEVITKHIKPKDKTIIDLGCSVGGISLGMVEKGAKEVLGIDYDKESIEVAREANKILGFNAEFECREITMDWVKNEMPYASIVIWLSQWQWIVRQKGLDYAKKLLFEVSKKADTMIFSSAADDGMARIKGATQDDIERWFWNSTVYRDVRRLPSTSGWMHRDLFYGKGNEARIENTKRAASSIIERIEIDKIKKTYRTNPKDCRWMKDREVKALKRLAPYKHFPKLLEEGDNYIVMDYIGKHKQVKYKEMKDQALEIARELKEVNIKHRDIIKRNFLAKDGQLYLIDFGWCIFDNEKDSPRRAPKEIVTRTEMTDKESVLNIFNIINYQDKESDTFEYLMRVKARGYNMGAFVPLLYTITQNMRGCKTILEIGVRWGTSTKAFLLGMRQRSRKDRKLYSIDIDKNCKRHIPRHLRSNWEFITGDSNKLEWDKEIDVLLIDGDHSYEGVKKDFEKYYPFVRKGGLILMHDVLLVEGVKKYWNELKMEKVELPLTKAGLGIIRKR